MAKQCIIVQTSTDDKEILEKITNVVLDKRLAACINIIPSVQSIFRWEGKISNLEEYILQIKTLDKNYTKIEKVILELHNYQTPEIISVEIKNIEKNFHEWLNNETK